MISRKEFVHGDEIDANFIEDKTCPFCGADLVEEFFGEDKEIRCIVCGVTFKISQDGESAEILNVGNIEDEEETEEDN